MSIISAGTSNTTTLVYTGDTTGAMVFQTNGTTEAMRITSGQNVGIGTSSPTAKLHVTSTNGQIVTQATSGNPSLLLRSATNNRNWEVFSWAGNAGEFGVYDGIAEANRLIIDSSGRVTTPAQPAFRVYHNNTLSWNSGALSPIVYNTSVFNIGNHYNTSNGIFTAPIAGRYLFTVYEMFMDEPSYTFIYLAVQINGSTTTEFMRQGTKPNYDTFGGTVLVSLAANDQVRIVCGLADVNAGYLRAGVEMNSFMGYLIG